MLLFAIYNVCVRGFNTLRALHRKAVLSSASLNEDDVFFCTSQKLYWLLTTFWTSLTSSFSSCEVFANVLQIAKRKWASFANLTKGRSTHPAKGLQNSFITRQQFNSTKFAIINTNTGGFEWLSSSNVSKWKAILRLIRQRWRHLQYLDIIHELKQQCKFQSIRIRRWWWGNIAVQCKRAWR